ncbi:MULTISPECIES: chemotaxis protein CheW [Candidatus Nitrosocaldus]|jgi:purine-binding chemotaxis protein CheW|uniref:Chemotaxis protein CheW (Modular protein) n=1 Tax=Candidatus Nitrosocaldus cavascurensis TaxID=2058097 RepID=A0A2K5ASE7_9ARCH
MMSSNILNLLLFKLEMSDGSAEYYAVDVDKIYEIRAMEKVTRIPDARIISGIMNLRGKIISVVDIKNILGYNSSVEPKRILIADVNGTMLGLMVDDVEQVAKVASDNIELDASILDNVSYIKGIIKMQDKLVVYLDIDKLFDMKGGVG